MEGKYNEAEVYLSYHTFEVFFGGWSYVMLLTDRLTDRRESWNNILDEFCFEMTETHVYCSRVHDAVSSFFISTFTSIYVSVRHVVTLQCLIIKYEARKDRRI